MFAFQGVLRSHLTQSKLHILVMSKLSTPISASGIAQELSQVLANVKPLHVLFGTSFRHVSPDTPSLILASRRFSQQFQSNSLQMCGGQDENITREDKMQARFFDA